MPNFAYKFHRTLCVCNEVVQNIYITFKISHVPRSKTSLHIHTQMYISQQLHYN